MSSTIPYFGRHLQKKQYPTWKQCVPYRTDVVKLSVLTQLDVRHFMALDVVKGHKVFYIRLNLNFLVIVEKKQTSKKPDTFNNKNLHF